MVEVTDWVSVSELLSSTSGYEHVVWKSDVDGLDIHILVSAWTRIDASCDTIWFEFDPASTWGPRTDVDALIDLIADSGRHLFVYDNLGRRMLELPPGQDRAAPLHALTGWLRQQRTGHVAVPYVDVWAFHDPAARLGERSRPPSL